MLDNINDLRDDIRIKAKDKTDWNLFKLMY